MKQLVQNLSTGEAELLEVPVPQVAPGQVLIATKTSVVSAGTERMLVEFGKAGWIGKVRQQPDKVKSVLQKVRTDGLMPTVEAVRSKLEEPLPVGYCNAGEVIGIGRGVTGFQVGDRVVSNGHHAEVVSVPANLCALIPEGVSYSDAGFTVLGAIALQSVRLLDPKLGETVLVQGLGLVGLLVVQLLRANGCRVVGADFDKAKCEIAEKLGAESIDLSSGANLVEVVNDLTNQVGVDGVIIAASTPSNEPISHAAQVCRKKGKVVLVGVVGLELSRADFYEKEITFQVSCSYGPGRYDPEYEQKGIDYPIGYVRWTEQRNFVAVLQLIASGQLNMELITSHRYPFLDANEAYSLLNGTDPYLGILLEYRGYTPESSADDRVPARTEASASPEVNCAFLGAGNYASRVLIPAFRQAGSKLKVVVSQGGLSSTVQAKRAKIEKASTDPREAYDDDSVNTVVIATRHSDHADQVVSALQSGKHVFVEKPLALTDQELDAIEEASAGSPGRLLMVGFNRRFSPLIVKAKQLLGRISGPKSVVITVNAGQIPSDHWTQDRTIGGGRIIGEACHFIDLARHLVDSSIDKVDAHKMSVEGEDHPSDCASITLTFQDGSLATIHYLANGSNAFPKERVEVFAGGRILQVDNFRRMKGFGFSDFNQMRLWNQDKGQTECVKRFVSALLEGGEAPISQHEIMEVSRASVMAAALLD